MEAIKGIEIEWERTGAGVFARSTVEFENTGYCKEIETNHSKQIHSVNFDTDTDNYGEPFPPRDGYSGGIAVGLSAFIPGTFAEVRVYSIKLHKA